MKVERKCKIVSKDWLNRDAVYMVLEVGDMVRTSWKGPGQFVHIKCGDSLLLRRPISVCSCMEEEPEDTLAIVFEVRGVTSPRGASPASARGNGSREIRPGGHPGQARTCQRRPDRTPP